MPEGVNSLGPPQCLQAYSSLPVARSYSLPLSVTPLSYYIIPPLSVCHSASHPLSTLSFLALYT